LLAHLGSRPERTRRIGLRADRRIPGTLDGEQVAAIMAACDRLRDRFLFTLLAESGFRVGEALVVLHRPRRRVNFERHALAFQQRCIAVGEAAIDALVRAGRDHDAVVQRRFNDDEDRPCQHGKR